MTRYCMFAAWTWLLQPEAVEELFAAGDPLAFRHPQRRDRFVWPRRWSMRVRSRFRRTAAGVGTARISR